MFEDYFILSQIIIINVIMSADNAIIIGMIAANFAPKNRYQIIMWGLLGALVFRIIFAVFASYLFGFAYIKIFGGLLLVWIVNDLRRDLFETKKIKSPTSVSKEPSYTNGTNVDGTPNSPAAMSMLKYNQCRPDCCPGTYSCSGGCVCLSKKQSDFINARGNNRTTPSNY